MANKDRPWPFCGRVVWLTPEQQHPRPRDLRTLRADRGTSYHGTKSAFKAGDELAPGYGSNFHEGRVSNNIYFTTMVDTAAWGAELATALAGSGERGRIYVVEPLRPFEDATNVANKRLPGNPTASYRSRHPLRVVGEADSWEGHDPEALKGMLDHLALLREQGLEVIED